MANILCGILFNKIQAVGTEFLQVQARFKYRAQVMLLFGRRLLK